MFKALNGLLCADVPLRNYSLTHRLCERSGVFIWFSGSRAFRISAPKIWNSLPHHLLQSQTLSSFRRHLKTHYFQSAYPAPYHPSPMRPDSLLRLWRYINHLLTYLLFCV